MGNLTQYMNNKQDHVQTVKQASRRNRVVVFFHDFSMNNPRDPGLDCGRNEGPGATLFIPTILTEKSPGVSPVL